MFIWNRPVAAVLAGLLTAAGITLLGSAFDVAQLGAALREATGLFA